MSPSRRARSDLLIVCHQFLPADPRIRRQLDALADAGIRADALCLRGAGESPRDGYRGHRIYRLPVRRHRGAGLATYLFEYLAFFALSYLAATALAPFRRYRVVITHTLPDPLVFVALVPRLFGARVIIDMHDFTPELFQTRHGLEASHPLIRLTRWLERVSCRFAHRIIAVHEPGAELLAARGVPRSKLVVVMNTDVMDRSAGATVRDADESGRRTSGSRPFTVVYHGLMLNQYALGLAIEAMVRVRAAGDSGVVLRIVGYGPDEAALREQADRLGVRDRVRFDGAVTPDQIPGILAECDVGLVPLRDLEYSHLMLPMKLLECAAHGLPVITMRTRTTRHYFPEEALCYVPFDDPDALAAGILRLRDDATYRETLRRRSADAVRPLRWEVMADRFVELVRNA